MQENVSNLRQFYDSHEGHNFCRIIRGIIEKRWRSPKKEKIIGYGFALPYLPILAADNKVIALMPHTIGALDMHKGISSVMVDESNLPIRNEVIDKIFAIHAVENSIDAQTLCFEFWRILAPYGRVIIVLDPKKYDQQKLVAILMANKFRINFNKHAVVSKKFPTLEALAPFTGQAQVIEAQKIIFAPRGRTHKIAKSIWDRVFKPKTAPAPAT